MDRIRTTHVGSLPRPEQLLKILYAREEGKAVDESRFHALADEAVDEAVRAQVAAGIDIVSDGELAKPGFFNYISNRISGFEPFNQPFSPPDLDDLPELRDEQYGGAAIQHFNAARCIAPLEYSGRDELALELRRMRGAVERAGATDAFVPATSPASLVRWPDEHYGSQESYLDALCAVLRVEYEAILDAGFMLQLDCPDIPMGASMMQEDWAQAEQMIDLAIQAINRATEGLPANRLRLHLCWGNWEGPHRTDVALQQILPLVWAARPHAISFEAANARHAHEWKVFEDLKVPDDKVIMPGVIDTKYNVVEHPELVAQRIERYAGLVGPENVLPGTDCGFGTFAGFGVVHPKVSWMKLEALGKGAALANERLRRS